MLIVLITFVQCYFSLNKPCLNQMKLDQIRNYDTGEPGLSLYPNTRQNSFVVVVTR